LPKWYIDLYEDIEAEFLSHRDNKVPAKLIEMHVDKYLELQKKKG
jgi:hypothetical protein